MKKSLPLSACSILLATLSVAPIGGAQAQNNEDVYQKREVIIVDDQDPPRVVDQRREVIIRDDPEPYRDNTTVFRSDRNRSCLHDGLSFLSTVSLGYNGLIEDLESLELPAGADFMTLNPKSTNFKLMLIDYDVNIARWLGLKTGLELEVANYRFEKNITLRKNDGGNVVPDYFYDNQGIQLTKSKLVNCFLNVPLLLRVNLSRTTELYGGVVGGWRWNSYQKIRTAENGRERIREDLNLRNFHYGYTAGILFDHFGFYATYYPHSMFKTRSVLQAGNDPKVQQVSVGISLRY